MQKPLKVAAVVNGRAGKNTKRQGMGRAAAEILTTSDLIFETSDQADLDAAVNAIVRGRPDVVAINGGDGTLQVTLTALLREHRRLAPKRTLPLLLNVPMGTMRIVATNLGNTRMDALEFAARVAARLRIGARLDTAALYPLCVNGDYGFLYGSALPVNMLHQYYRAERRGAQRVLQVLQETLSDEIEAALGFRKSRELLTKPVQARVCLPGHDPEFAPYMTHTTLMVASVKEVGLGCNGMPLAMSRDGHFHVRSSQMRYWEYLASGPALWLGATKSLPKTFDAVVDRAVIEYAEPTIATLDGEMRMPSLRDEISTGPTLTFITG